MTKDLGGDRLERLREDLAALRRRTTEEFGIPEHSSDLPPDATVSAAAGDDDAPDELVAPGPGGRVAAGAWWTSRSWRDRSSRQGGAHTRDGQAPRPPRRHKPPKPPKPARRGLRRPRTRRPPRRVAVPPPIAVSRRPDHLAAPRWPLWTPLSAAVATLVLVPATLQLVHRLAQAMLDTTVLLGADPTRETYLHAAAGVAGGGLTLAMAVAALAVVKGRLGYLAAAVGVIAVFGIFPHVAYTANAGIVAASLPSWEVMIRPPDWPHGGRLAAVFWLCAAALCAAVLDLAYRSVAAVDREFRS